MEDGIRSTTTSKSIDQNYPTNAHQSAALKLLQSITNAVYNPEDMIPACLDWLRLAEEANSVPEFEQILANLLLSSRHAMKATAHSDIRVRYEQAVNFEDVFFINAHGVIEKIPQKLSELFNASPGDLIAPGLAEISKSPEFVSSFPRAHQIELVDRFQIRRAIALLPINSDKKTVRYSAHYIRPTVSAVVHKHLRENYNLTPSEIEVLEATLMRLSIKQISEDKNIKPNTVRTHINRLNRKLGCHSLVETIGFILEMSLIENHKAIASNVDSINLDFRPRQVQLPRRNANLEYTIYGPPSGKPIIILHSAEYGYLPSRQFLTEAKAHGVSVIFPIRPGYGVSSHEASIERISENLRDFLEYLDLRNATLVGLSTAAPIALKVGQLNPRVESTILVNYGLSVADKISSIRPKWLRGLLKMSVATPASFAVALRLIRSFIGLRGSIGLYRTLYSKSSSDARFLEENAEMFELFGKYLSGAGDVELRIELVSAFLPYRELPMAIRNQNSVVVLNGSEQHGVSYKESMEDAQNLGVEFHPIVGGGRNWLFEHPDLLFRHITTP